MNRICMLALMALALVAVGCTHETVVYRTHNTYYRAQAPERSPATIPGQPVRLANPGEPATFRAESGN